MAESYEYYEENCRNKTGNETIVNSTRWIVANPFSSKNSNYMIRNASKDNYTDADSKKSNIQGLIFISDQEITSENLYNPPELIAIASKNMTQTLKQFSYDQTNPNGTNSTNTTIVTAVMIHTFQERCSII